MWPCVCLIAVSDATVRDTWKVACTQQGTLHYPGRLELSQHQCVPVLVAAAITPRPAPCLTLFHKTSTPANTAQLRSLPATKLAALNTPPILSTMQ